MDLGRPDPRLSTGDKIFRNAFGPLEVAGLIEYTELWLDEEQTGSDNAS